MSRQFLLALHIACLTSASLLTLSEVANTVEQDGKHDGATDERALPEGVDAKQAKTVADYLDQCGPDQRAGGSADATRQIGAADNCGSNDLEFHTGANIGGDG